MGNEIAWKIRWMTNAPLSSLLPFTFENWILKRLRLIRESMSVESLVVHADISKKIFCFHNDRVFLMSDHNAMLYTHKVALLHYYK